MNLRLRSIFMMESYRVPLVSKIFHFIFSLYDAVCVVVAYLVWYFQWMYHHGESSIEFYWKRTMTSPGLNGHSLGIENLGLSGEAMSLTLARGDHPTMVSLGHFSHSLTEQLTQESSNLCPAHRYNLGYGHRDDSAKWVRGPCLVSLKSFLAPLRGPTRMQREQDPVSHLLNFWLAKENFIMTNRQYNSHYKNFRVNRMTWFGQLGMVKDWNKIAN